MADRWLTYQQAGEVLGLTAEAVRHRARRLGWRTQPGNEGRTLVLVPDDEAVRAPVRPAAQAPVQTAVQSGDANGSAELLREQTERADKWAQDAAELRERVGRLEAEVETLWRKAATERARAEQAEVEREEARIAAARAEGEAAALREQIKAERGRAELARDADAARVQAAEDAREAARAELADWTGGGPLARAWRALIYRRGRP